MKWHKASKLKPLKFVNVLLLFKDGNRSAKTVLGFWTGQRWAVEDPLLAHAKPKYWSKWVWPDESE